MKAIILFVLGFSFSATATVDLSPTKLPKKGEIYEGVSNVSTARCLIRVDDVNPNIRAMELSGYCVNGLLREEFSKLTFQVYYPAPLGPNVTMTYAYIEQPKRLPDYPFVDYKNRKYMYAGVRHNGLLHWFSIYHDKQQVMRVEYFRRKN